VSKEQKTDICEFSYNLGNVMKIDLEAAKEKKNKKLEENKKQFEELKKQMEDGAGNVVPHKTPKNLTNNKY